MDLITAITPWTTDSKLLDMPWTILSQLFLTNKYNKCRTLNPHAIPGGTNINTTVLEWTSKAKIAHTQNEIIYKNHL